MAIYYVKGDATNPVEKGNIILAHICNDIGAWGKGFVLAISKKWKTPEIEYKRWYQSKQNFMLGEVQFVPVEDFIVVANMIAQHEICSRSKKKPICYEAVEKCLEQVAKKAILQKATIHMPRIGCGLAGGKWEEIEFIIKRTLLEKQLDVWVYDF